MNEQNYNVSEDVTEEVGEILDKVDRLGPEQKEQAMLTLEMHYGPIPHPEILKKYEELDKGAAKLIIENGVQESVHRREMEKSYFKKSEREKKRGQYLGFLIGTIVISGGVWLINGGHAITGTLLSGTSLLGLVGSFTSNESGNQTKRTSEEKTKEDE